MIGIIILGIGVAATIYYITIGFKRNGKKNTRM
jgi:hypothetical protein